MREQRASYDQPQRPSQARATDLAYGLDLAPNFFPDVDLVVTEGVATFGVKGAGKSTVCARLLEQVSRFPLPYLVADTKGEYASLKDVGHATRFVLATANACPSGQEIISQRLHVVLDLRTWQSDEGAALAMTQLLTELCAYASSLDPAHCVPCPCILDEAQYWVPQSAVSHLCKESAHQLRDAWHVLATRGRSLGLVPSYFTQNISELHKSVMRQCGLYALMRQVLDRDLDRYCEYIRASRTAQQVKRAIRAFPAGKALVVLPSGEQLTVQFHPRASTHTSTTPTVRALVGRLAARTPAVEVLP